MHGSLHNQILKTIFTIDNDKKKNLFNDKKKFV